jgi:membrane protein
LLIRGRFPDANGGSRKKKIVGHVPQNDLVRHDQKSMNQQPGEATQYGNSRGKEAPTPRQIPKGGWWSICKRVYASLNTKHLSILAGGVAFYAMLSIFPALAALVAIYGLIADPATVQHQINAIHGLIPGEAQKMIETYLKSIVSSSSSKLGFSLIVSVALALWSARAGTVSLIQALNITYEEDEKRGAIRYQAVALG